MDVLVIDGPKGGKKYVRALRSLRRALTEDRFDLIHAHYGLSGAIALAQRHVPVVTTFHGSDTGYVRWQRYISWVVARLTTPIFVTRDGADRLGIRGATVIPIYSLNLAAPPPVKAGANVGPPSPGNNAVISCQGLRELAVLGQCAPGRSAVKVSTSNFQSDNPYYSTQPIASASSPAASDNLSHLYLQAVLIKVHNATTLERVRTFLVTHTPQSVSGTAPRTFGEAVQAREGVVATVQRLFYIAVILTLVVAGCSLAVAVGGSLVERKRPFTLLRVTGTATATLYRVVLLEAVFPLVTASVVAAGTAYGISVLTVRAIAPAGTPLPVLGHVYYLMMGAGLAASLLVILASLPLLGRITGPANVRFE